ncbi:Uncharacterised protein [Budvicia aquatica]|uniref:Uncharacterized protein n=1 Tax=Budvicia aquatica TaxID=82979 RepID=A0A484ZU36_9GAMM|nr:Uncharacterised protein [Budvicia aquatica]
MMYSIFDYIEVFYNHHGKNPTQSYFSLNDAKTTNKGKNLL